MQQIVCSRLYAELRAANCTQKDAQKMLRRCSKDAARSFAITRVVIGAEQAATLGRGGCPSLPEYCFRRSIRAFVCACVCACVSACGTCPLASPPVESHTAQVCKSQHGSKPQPGNRLQHGGRPQHGSRPRHGGESHRAANRSTASAPGLVGSRHVRCSSNCSKVWL